MSGQTVAAYNLRFTSLVGGAYARRGWYVLSSLPTALWIWMLVDAISNEPSEGNDKVIWVLVIIFLHGLGALLYYFIRRPERIRKYGK